MDTQDLQRIKNRYDIVGNSSGLNKAIETAVAVAPTDLAVLISGESGVGKENIPRIIHQNSLRRNGKYFAINCGGIPEGTINSELFGHEKGSFTGATTERKGYFEEADGGTLFLDEIGELPMSTQVMLLRVLQDGEFIKVGSSKVEKTDVRIIAATNVNLEYAIAQGKFRADLYYRLCGIHIRMPALRERKDDIYLLFRKFTSDFSEKYRSRKVTLSHDAITMLQNYSWPGNIRQLKNIADAISALESQKITSASDRCEIDAATLAMYLPRNEENALPAVVAGASSSSMNDEEKKMIIKALLDLKQEVDALKAAVFKDGATHVQPQQLPEPHHIYEAEWQGGDAPVAEEDLPPHRIVDVPASAPEEPEDLSLEKISSSLITKALEKHNGNRKLAAQELGISERTLYRKLKNTK